METAGLIAGSGWASGISLYLVVAALGMLGRAGYLDAPELFMRDEVLVGAVVLLLLEFVVDKIPVVDTVWDVVHTAVRPVGAFYVGQALATSVGADHLVAPGAGSAALAVTVHVSKTAGRAALNLSPEPFSTMIASLAGGGLAAGVLYLAVVRPEVALLVVGVLTVAAVALLGVGLGALRRARRRRASRIDIRPGVSRP